MGTARPGAVDVVETTWAGPTMPGLDPLPDPIVEVQYRLHLG